MPKHYFNRLEYLSTLIEHKCTGSPELLAQKMGVSKRTVFDYINILKSLDATIEYDIVKQTYFFQKNGKFNFRFLEKKD